MKYKGWKMKASNNVHSRKFLATELSSTIIVGEIREIFDQLWIGFLSLKKKGSLGMGFIELLLKRFNGFYWTVTKKFFNHMRNIWGIHCLSPAPHASVNCNRCEDKRFYSKRWKLFIQILFKNRFIFPLYFIVES